MIYAFDDIELDTRLFELRRNGEPRPVEPQVFNVLLYLVEHADHVVTKDELLERLWPGRVVSESALTSRLKAARRVIGDSGRDQRFIRTIHGRGYRFVKAVEARKDPAQPREAAPAAAPARPAAHAAGGATCRTPVGRAAELAMLERHLQAAERGALQIVFIEGEAGLGKTTLIESFVALAEAGGRARVAVGQCVELSTAGEAYMPLLDALGGLCGRGDGEGPVASMAEVAPSWLLQLPGLSSAADRQAIERRVIGPTPERMLREFAAAARALGSERPLVLVLEDLHWSDPSTLALLAWLGRRKEPMRVLLVCSYRPGEQTETGRSLSETVYGLRLRGRARLVTLEALGESDISLYLRSRLPGCEFTREIVAALHDRTEGNPLFVASVVDGWIDSRKIVESGSGWRLEAPQRDLFAVVPHDLRLIIDDQLSRLGSSRRRLLEAASVAGMRFASALVEALCADDGRDDCENELSALAEASPFIARDADVEWPDRTLSSQFRFTHTLYRETLYAALPARRRARMHAVVAERLEQAFGEAAAEHAVDLARHWSAGGNADRAVHYRLAAANQAFTRSGYREAIGHIEQGLDLLARHPELEAHDARELGFRLLHAHALIQTNGWSDACAEAALERGLEIAEACDDERLPSVLYLLAAVHELRGEYAESRRWLERQQKLPRAFTAPLARLESHELMACSMYHQGAFETALEHAEAGLSAADVLDTDSRLYVYGENPRVSCHNWAGLALWFLGFPDAARRRVEEALELARKPARKYSLSHALCQAATLSQLAGEPEAVLALAREAIDVAHEEGFTYPLAVAKILAGWAQARTTGGEEGLALIREGLDGHRASGANMDRPYYLALLADAHAAAEQWDSAREVLDAALAQIDGSRRFFYEAELWRLRAELAVAPGGEGRRDAQTMLERAVDAAVDQDNRIGRLRAESDLVRLAAGTRSASAYLDALRETCASFDGETTSADLVAARALLQAESGRRESRSR